jgi:hypothetical protein
MIPHALVLLAVAAQGPRPLDKVEVIRLLTNPLFAQAEVADVVRRSCVAFRPTERDWADLRNAGAGGEVIASVAACTTRRATPPPAAPAPPPAPLTAVAVTPDIVASAGTPSSVRVFVHRGGAPQRRIPVTLRGTTSVGLPRDASGTTDDSGVVVFPLPPVSQPGVHRFEVVGNNGSLFPGRPTVTLSIRAGDPGRLRVAPDYIGSAENGATVVATVTDSMGNPLAREPVELSTGIGAPQSVATDSIGHASFVLPPAALPRGGALQLRVRKLAAVEVPVADVAGLSGALTGFVGAASRRGRVGSPLADPVSFRARTVQGAAPVGRVVRFRAVNARVRPDSVVLDSTGTIPLDIVLGARTGDALVFARIDSVEKLLTLHADPGPIATLVLEYLGEPVTGREISVRVATPFVLRVTARDLYNNETTIEPLAQLLRANRAQQSSRQQRELEIMNLEFSEDAVLVTLRAQRMQTYEFTIGSGITATVRVRSLLM